MNKCKGFSKLWFLALLLVAFVAGCASNAQEISQTPGAPGTPGSTTDTIAPLVSVTSPVNLAADVPNNRIVYVSFSEVMTQSTIAATGNFTVKVSGANGAAVQGAVKTYPTSATFTPSPATPLASNTNYTVTIKGSATGVKDFAGNPMVNDFSFTFKTGLTSDTVRPTVSFTNPANLAKNVPLDKIIFVGFSDVMNPATLIAGNFTVTGPNAATIIQGKFTSFDTSISFEPSIATPLVAGTTYTVTVKGGPGGVADLAGNLLAGTSAAALDVAGNYVFTFDTAAAFVPPVVLIDPLGTASKYGIMANSAITLSAPAKSHIYGDVGILATDTFTGFTLIPVAPPTAVSPTSLFVTGQITSFGYNSGNRAALVTAFNDLKLAWTNNNSTNKPAPLTPPVIAGGVPAAGGTFVAANKDLTGMLLGPGIYASDTPTGTLALSNTSGPLVLDAGGVVDAVFIFQAGDITTTSGSVVLRNGAQSKNIYWVVTNTATIGNGLAATLFQGTILAGTDVTVGLDTSVEGRVLAGAGLVAGTLTINGGVVTVP